MKKVLKDIHYCTLKELVLGQVDLGMTLDGKDLINMDLVDAASLLNKNDMITDDGRIIIPAGAELIRTTKGYHSDDYDFNLVDDIKLNVALNWGEEFGGEESDYIG